MPKNKTKFSDSCFSNPEYNGWLSKKDGSTARCSYCCKDVDLSNMGKAALRSHKKSKGRCKCIKYFIKHNEILMFDEMFDAFEMNHNFEKKRKEEKKSCLTLFDEVCSRANFSSNICTFIKPDLCV